jgi:putative hydrolase of HD superfamily
MKELANFLYESGVLSKVKRSGYWLIGVDNPESVAEHAHRASIIGYFLSKLEKVDANKVVLMCVFHDIHEARLNDLHKVGHRYIDFREAEVKAHNEQLGSLNGVGDDLLEMFDDLHGRKSPESEVARDADLLENALSAKEYIKIGYSDAQNWIDNIWKIIKTENGKKLLKMIEETDPNDWWRELKKIDR